MDDDALYERLADLAAQLVEEPQHTPVLAKVLSGKLGDFADVSTLASPSSLVAVELLRLKRDHGVRLMATHLPCPPGDPLDDDDDDDEPPEDVSMVIFYIPELAAIAETALLDRTRIFELTQS
jgi:hypothetical protein